MIFLQKIDEDVVDLRRSVAMLRSSVYTLFFTWAEGVWTVVALRHCNNCHKCLKASPLHAQTLEASQRLDVVIGVSTLPGGGSNRVRVRAFFFLFSLLN